MRGWGWRGAAVVAGVGIAAGLAAVGQWEGGLAGAAVIAVGGFLAPEVSERLKKRHEDAIQLAEADRVAHTAFDKVSSPALLPPADQARGGDAFWLRPDQRVVGFIGRPELTKLQNWCADKDTPQVLLLTGAGGVGKTRLALQLAEEEQVEGWLCRMVRAGGEADVTAAVRAVSKGPVLLIVDYAEARQGLAGLFEAVAGDRADRLRVLLIARSVGEWWKQLEASTEVNVRMLAAMAGHMPVGALSGAAVNGAELVRAAVPEFARALGVVVPRQVSVTVPEKPVPILVLHATALLTVLHARDNPHAGPVQVVADEHVLTELLAHEKAFWLGSARIAELFGSGGMDSVTAAQAVAVACLIPVADESEAEQALRRVPGLDDGAPLRMRIARWLRQLYPADRSDPLEEAARWWGSLQPDLLAERHVVSELAEAPELANACLRDLTAVQARGALTVLARACEHSSHSAGIIAAALRADLPGLGVPAVEVAVQTGRLGRILDDVLGDADVPLATLMQIEEAIPYPTVVLAGAAATLADRVGQMLPADADQVEIARRLNRLGLLLGQADRPHQALVATQKAVGMWRELAAANPDQYRPDLAEALDHLGCRFYKVGRTAEAVPLTQEALRIWRDPAAANSDRYRRGLAKALDNLSVWFYEVGRTAEAPPLTQEAVPIWRELAAADPDRYRPDLAGCMSNLSVWFDEVGRTAEALPLIQEAVQIRRDLAAANPDRYRPDLAHSLDNLGKCFYKLRRTAEALPVAQEAVEVRRELAAANPDRYRPDLAHSLGKLAALFSKLGQNGEASATRKEARAIRSSSPLDPEPRNE